MAKSKKKISKRPVISLIMMLLCIISGFFSIYSLSLLNGIETKIRIVLSAIIAVLLFAFIIAFLGTIKKKNKKYILYTILGLIYSISLLTFGYYIVKTYKVVDKFSSDTTTYSSSLVTLSTNKVDDIKDVKGKVGMVSDEKNIIGYEIPNEIIEKNDLNVDIKEYDTYVDLITALYDEKVDYIFLPTNYSIMFANYEGADFSKIDEETKIVYTQEKEVSNEISSTSSLSKPFTILLMGVDSEDEEIANSSFNGDSLMLITFNPTTLNATILSIPRDTYVPIACFAGQSKSKITHAAWYGENCMMNTIENFTGISIDYYVKINFKGLVKIVDTLGGVDVDVPYNFCEQNSDRKFGNDTVYVNKGYQTLNGEQALAFSRNRHAWPQYCSAEYSNYISNDFIRGQNQQTVLKAILNKIKQKGNLQTIYNLLDVVSNSMETNMSTSEILSLYNIGKDVFAKSSNGASFDDAIGMQRLYLSGKDAYIYDTNVGMTLYNFVLYNESLKAVTQAMKINLGQEEPTLVKEFSFDIDDEYEEEIVGKIDSGTTASYNQSTTSTKKQETTTQTKQDTSTKAEDKKQVTLPNFIGMTYLEAKKTASSLGIYLNPSSMGDSKIITSQEFSKGTSVDVGVTIKVTLKEETIKVDDTTTDDKKENDENKTTDDSNDENTNLTEE